MPTNYKLLYGAEIIMRDTDIRKVLLKSLQDKYGNKRDTLVIEELGLCQGNSRVDIAVVNGSMHGYEIKSERDTLDRLPSQRDYYNRVLDCVTVVASPCHLLKLEKLVPSWWGLCEAEYKKEKLRIRKIRPNTLNTEVDPSAIVQLLWREEALDALRKRDLHKGVISKSREVLWGRLVECLAIDELRFEVRERIKARQYWRSVQTQK